jgi:hypothetical protein
MRTPAVFAVILVGAPLLATAQPKQEETSGRVSLKEKAPDDPREDAPRSPSDWVELASATAAKHGTNYIIVGGEAGGFGKLRIDAVKGGGIPIKQVRVSFTDGSSKTYRVNRRIDPQRQKSVFLDLPTTQQIDQVVIVTDRRSKGEYAVYGSGTGGVVAGR